MKKRPVVQTPPVLESDRLAERLAAALAESRRVADRHTATGRKLTDIRKHLDTLTQGLAKATASKSR